MTDKEIKKLAEECSLYYQGRPAKRGYELSNRLTIESYAQMTLKWLSERYCIVPKEKLDALQDEIHGEIMCAHDDDDWQSVAHYILDVMPRSFNGLFGKDMFKENKI